MLYRSFLMIFIFISLIVVLISCGDVDVLTKPPPQEVAEISAVLKDRWKQGYETEDLELYMSSFWKDGYFYWSDMATDSVDDDVIFDQWDQERESAIKVFKNYRNIELEITDPPGVKILDEARTQAEVTNHYKIQFYVPEGTSLPGGYEAYYAEGDNTFIFDYRDVGNGKKEWRITQWRDNALSAEEIETNWKLQ